MKKLAAILTLTILSIAFFSNFSTAEATSGAPIVVDEVQAGTTNYRHEMVVLRNRTEEVINLDQYKVIISDGEENIAVEIALTGDLAGYGLLFLFSEPYLNALDEEVKTTLDYMSFKVDGDNALASGGGHVVLVDEANEIDRLGYGDALQPETLAAPYLPSSSVLKRCSNVQGMSVDTDDNSVDFLLSDTPMILEPGGLCENSAIEPVCNDLVLSEILPNPVGVDGGNEFIELHNPTEEELTLLGCSLQLGAKTYELPEEASIAAGEYRAFYDSETGITLPNAAGGEVTLITTDVEEVVQYPGGLADDEAWALVEEEWQQTLKPTPDALNEIHTQQTGGKGGSDMKPCAEGKYRHPETNRCRNIETETGLTPCQPGQERNPATNRCRSTATAANTLTPCKEGQERNPATNRCRSTITASSTLKPCAADQERNPETNRCKKVASEASSLVPCKEGQERNPETNRCRKIRETAEAAFAVEEAPPAAGSQVGWWAAGAVGAGAAGYGVFQWRQEITGLLRKLRPSRAKNDPPEPDVE